MSTSHITLTPQVLDYVQTFGSGMDPLLQELIEETQKLQQARMQLAPQQGNLLKMFAHITQAKRIIEVGTFTGYSSICLARGLLDDGQLICLDTSEEWTRIAKKYWERANLSSKITLILGSGEESFKNILDHGHQDQSWVNTVDIVFVDANKSSYDTYYEYALEALRPDGVAIFDNVLWGGDVANADTSDPISIAIHKLNVKISKDPRVSCSIIPLGDGLMVARKKPISAAI